VKNEYMRHGCILEASTWAQHHSLWPVLMSTESDFFVIPYSLPIYAMQFVSRLFGKG